MLVGVHSLIRISANQNIDLLGFCNWLNPFKQRLSEYDWILFNIRIFFFLAIKSVTEGNIYLFLCLGFSAESLSVQMCKEMVNELWQTIHKATGFYNKVIYLNLYLCQGEQI